jgi:dihydroxyacetone kinase-like predicted kinase
MLEKLRAIRTAEVTVAARDGKIGELDIPRGSYFGTSDGEAVAVADDVEEVALEVVAGIVEGERSYLVVVLGEGAPEEARLRAAIEAAHPGLELDFVAGGQPHHPLLFVAE